MLRKYYIGQCLFGLAVGIALGAVWLIVFGCVCAPWWVVATVAVVAGFAAEWVIAAGRRWRTHRGKPRRTHAR